MSSFVETLMEEINANTVFTIPIFGGIEVAESTVVTWIIMAVVLALCVILTRNLKVTNISKRQAAIESFVTWINKFVTGMVGEEGKGYVPYLVTVLIYISVADIFGIFGMKPPTKDMNVTAALALMSIFLIEYAGIHKKGVKGWLKAFKEPLALIAPINILEVFIRPLSLCMRLFGNVIGAFVIMKLLEHLCAVILPVPFSLYFDFFDGLLQAYIFVFLTSLFVKEAIE